jgi:hypothetical protein
MRLKSPASEDGASTSPLDKPTSYRTGGSLGTGAFLVVFGAIFFFAFGLGSEKHPVGSMVGLLMVVCGVLGGIYPAAFSHPDRLTIRNPFRRIEISWPRVESVSARLSMVVETVPEDGAAHKFTIWAIPVSMHDRRKADRAANKKMRDARAAATGQSRGAGDVAGGAIGGAGYGRPKAYREDPVDSMAFADQAVVEMRDRRRVCTTSLADAAPTKVTWTWYTLVPFGASIALLVAAIAGAF